jgi:putative transcriptional regulator
MPRNIASEILEGLNEASAYLSGEATEVRKTCVYVPESVDVKAIRERLNLTQVEFARNFALPLDTLRKWERGVRMPDAASRAYLTMIARDPQMVVKTLRAA